MNEKIEKLFKREEEIKERFGKMSNAADSLRQISKTDWHPDFRYLLGMLEKKADHLKEMQMKVWEKIKKEQDKCPHKYPDGRDAHTKYMGHGHNWSYYRCVFCDHEEER